MKNFNLPHVYSYMKNFNLPHVYSYMQCLQNRLFMENTSLCNLPLQLNNKIYKKYTHTS